MFHVTVLNSSSYFIIAHHLSMETCLEEYTEEFCFSNQLEEYPNRILSLYSFILSAILVTQSIMSCIIQSVVYPWLINTLNISIPIIAIIGMICMSLGIALVTLPTLWLMILASTILSIGYCLSSPTSVSILSV